MSSALSILGVAASSTELAQLCDPEGRSTFATLKRYAEGKGLFAEAVRLMPDQLAKLHRVAILQVVSRMNPASPFSEHFVTWAGPGSRPGTGVVFDPVPNGGRGEVPMSVLSGKWTGVALVLSDEHVRDSELSGRPSMAFLLFRASALGAAAGVAGLGLLARPLRQRR
jgi:ABC-type bacteriocin/lantibiotic exporter with double-glycine peptidase domain